MVEFYLFDIPGAAGPLKERLYYLDTMSSVLGEYLAPWATYVKRPERWEVQGRAGLDLRFTEVRERGLEGLMVKDLRGEYVAGTGHRSDWWLKMKPESEADGKIVGVNRAVSIEGVPLDRAGSIDVLCEDGSTASPAGIAHELGEDMWAHPEKYIGRWIEFKYMERDRQYGYRHPSFTRFREDKA
jgi:ATP-dependent DNA ligase